MDVIECCVSEKPEVVRMMKLLLCLLGLVLVVEGLPYFACPDKMKSWMRKLQEIPDPHLRAMGFAAMCLGLVMAYLFRT